MSSESADNAWAIRVQDLGKQYRLFDKPHHRLLQSLWRERRKYYRDFTALEDVSFELERGQTLGIIGRNGAGKSTLLQMICGTLTPSSGNVQVRGRIAALLELGTGFNPEFTGRENLSINAAILGLTPEEIAQRADDIIAFADIGPFIDQPVKTYSSGMYVRLAFAVVVHVDPDILIVDEALAVGDAFFQAKCMTRMRNMLDSGLTLLFISHDISAVKALCNRTLWLERGRVRAVGDTSEITRAYDQDWIQQANLVQGASAESVRAANPASDSPTVQLQEESPHVGTGVMRLLAVGWSVDGALALQTRAEFGDTLSLRMRVQARTACNRVVVSYHIKNRQNQHVLGGHSADRVEIYDRDWQAGDVADLVFSIPIHLQHGDYALTLVAASIADTERYSDATFHFWADDVATLQVVQRSRFPLSDIFEPPPELSTCTDAPWVVLDDFFPNLLTGFRVAEYNAHLQKFPQLMVLSSLGDFAQQRSEYAKLYPALASKIQPYSPNWLDGAAMAYVTFLNNAAHYLTDLEKHAVPFVLNLYPGGGFGLHDAESDAKLLRVLSSRLLKAIIVTQAITEQYLQAFADRNDANLPVIHRIDGVAVSALYFEAETLHDLPRYGSGKEYLDVCFVAERYMPWAENKGYPDFLCAVQLLADQPVLRFHVVGGGYTADEMHQSDFTGHLEFHGRLETSELRKFYAGMDIIVSCSRPGLLHQGNFDGFPTGCCVEASLCGVAMMVTDAMRQNPGYLDEQNIFLLESEASQAGTLSLPHQIAHRIRELLQNPAQLTAVAAAGQEFSRGAYAPEVQIGRRQDILRSVAASSMQQA